MPIFEEETSEWDEDTVSEYLWARVTMTDEEWEEDERECDISRAEAFERIENKDYSPPF